MKRVFWLFNFLVLAVSSNAQQSVNSGGGTSNGSGGVVTFTTGQSTFTVASGTGGSNSAGVQQAYIVTNSGVQDANLSISVKVFPNPASHLLQIETAQIAGLRYEMFDAAGRKMHEGKIKNGKATQDLSRDVPGSYQLIIFQKQKNIQSFTILKNNL